MAFNLFRWLRGAVDTAAGAAKDVIDAAEDATTFVGEAGEDLTDLLKNPFLTLPRKQAKGLAAAYALQDDGEAFEELWGLTVQALLFAHSNHEAAKAEVDREIALLRNLADMAPDAPTSFGRPVTALRDDGFKTLQVAATTGKYIIFSDHHMLFHGNRQNFFTEGTRTGGEDDGNRALYLEVLSRFYGPEQYTLVENGDVEELIILEPKITEINNIASWNWDEVISFREEKKLPQLREIARDNRAYYSTIERHFIAPERYFRITGNHDRDMREPAFAAAVSETAGIDMPLASDALILRGPSGVDFIVTHGHQFDTACTPKFAAEQGESFSQASAWAFQGPDRVWRMDKDPIEDWLSGGRSFANMLVTDEPAGRDGLDIPLVNKTPKELALVVQQMIGALEKRKDWENLFDKNVAWEYFENAGAPQKAMDEEVATGDRWFKYRHMNEMRIVDGLRAAFAGTRLPTLVLGHSHEPRLRAGHPQKTGAAAVADCYLNTASAGRFQNLIWGVELIDGAPSMISWHRGDRTVGDQPVRTIWTDRSEGGKSVLKPQSSAPLDALLTGDADDARARTNLHLAIEHAL